MAIGGFFTYEELLTEKNGFMDTIEGDVVYTMSGRCGIYYCLQDLLLSDKKKTAYLPVYTCETVLDNYVKAGYTMIFYDVNDQLQPIFKEEYLEEISLLHICGYFGFITYDDSFINNCVKKGISILEDTTHSHFTTNGLDSRATYLAGSFRKWIGVHCGGYAVKRNGSFTLPLKSPHPKHLAMRKSSITDKTSACHNNNPSEVKRATDEFWSAEMLLRQVFDSYSSDESSIEIINHLPFEPYNEIRRNNWQYLSNEISKITGITSVFKTLPEGTVPSHFVVYSSKQEKLKDYLNALDIHCTIYWPLPPMVDNIDNYPSGKEIYNKILALPCDYRYSTEDMASIVKALKDFFVNDNLL